MLTEFDTALPSVRQVQRLITQKTGVELKLLTGDMVRGKFIWQDQNCICVIDENDQQITVWKQAIAYMKPQD